MVPMRPHSTHLFYPKALLLSSCYLTMLELVPPFRVHEKVFKLFVLFLLQIALLRLRHFYVPFYSRAK
ncbi:CLUMA_CG006391, isoform A [Clunio marinus]|uniref:CLUMA_CG006391, isoform A n=1 Tax=Clunio marinus TaxID=568069 RepID=A0A1J1HXN8_9DIPT|nr:CLUMA_CG006391, isoform A [Clunio marinus]